MARLSIRRFYWSVSAESRKNKRRGGLNGRNDTQTIQDKRYSNVTETLLERYFYERSFRLSFFLEDETTQAYFIFQEVSMCVNRCLVAFYAALWDPIYEAWPETCLRSQRR